MQEEIFWGKVLVYFSCYFFKERAEESDRYTCGSNIDHLLWYS